MKYFVTVDGQEHELELVERLGRLEVTYDGEPIEVDYNEVDRLGQLALFLGDRSYGVSIEGDESEAVVTVAGEVYLVEIEDERERAAHAAERAGAAGGGIVKSVMPGIVVEVLVSEGETVEKGAPLLILEAMKMQNEIPAPASGRVDRIHVSQGQAVGSGEKLVAIVSEDG